MSTDIILLHPDIKNFFYNASDLYLSFLLLGKNVQAHR